MGDAFQKFNWFLSGFSSGGPGGPYYYQRTPSTTHVGHNRERARVSTPASNRGELRQSSKSSSCQRTSQIEVAFTAASNGAPAIL